MWKGLLDFYIFLYLFREDKVMMTKLKKLLTTSSKIRRNRRRLLNLQIQFFAWLVELSSGLIFLIAISLPMHTISTDAVALCMNFIYWVAIPGIYLINNNDLKSWLMENHLYIKFSNKFFPSTINTIDFGKDDNDSDTIE